MDVGPDGIVAELHFECDSFLRIEPVLAVFLAGVILNFTYIVLNCDEPTISSKAIITNCLLYIYAY